MSRAVKIAGLALICASPILVHVGLLRGFSPVFVAPLVVLEACVVSVVLFMRSSAKWRWLAALLAAGAVGVVAAKFGLQGLAVATGVPHAVAYTGLLVFFAHSLVPGGEPIITTLIRRIRGVLPEEVVRYGRRLTIAWCIFFGAQLAGSLVLFLTTPIAAWSYFINVMNLPLVLGMFLAEYAYRLVRFRHLPRSRLTDMIRAILGLRASAPRIAE